MHRIKTAVFAWKVDVGGDAGKKSKGLRKRENIAAEAFEVNVTYNVALVSQREESKNVTMFLFQPNLTPWPVLTLVKLGLA